MAAVFIGIGSNLGNKVENINSAVGYLKEVKGISVYKVSSTIASEPVDAPGPDYLNAVVKITTEIPPKDLLGILQRCEKKLGRRRPYNNAPRIIDLDILLYGGEVIDEPDLEIPHPRMYEREFVMKPLLEIEPNIKKTIKKLISQKKQCFFCEIKARV